MARKFSIKDYFYTYPRQLPVDQGDERVVQLRVVNLVQETLLRLQHDVTRLESGNPDFLVLILSSSLLLLPFVHLNASLLLLLLVLLHVRLPRFQREELQFALEGEVGDLCVTGGTDSWKQMRI